jgi:hypothetical protein
VEQLGNLKTHPAVAARLEQGDLQIHGWIITSVKERSLPGMPAGTTSPRCGLPKPSS